MRTKEVLKEYGLTQTELAERLQMNRVSVSRLLSEDNDMRSSTLQKIAAAIGCTVGELFEKKEPSAPNTFTCPHCGKQIKFQLGT